MEFVDDAVGRGRNFVLGRRSSNRGPAGDGCCRGRYGTFISHTALIRRCDRATSATLLLMVALMALGYFRASSEIEAEAAERERENWNIMCAIDENGLMRKYLLPSQ